MASSPRPPHEDAAAAVCCMCGDHGLPRELFRCRSCRVRVQHRYCSDLYPRAAAYRRCNWCLRDPAESGGAAGHCVAAASKPTEKRKTAAWEVTATSASAADEDHRQQPREACSRRPPPAEPGRLVKKHKANERASPPPTAAAGAGAVKGSDTGKKVMQAGKTPVRAKVRRYKLLAEVISC
ncbi:hypothetical protein ACP70R_009731 [Stipagrostis hirtigluma subsp. patula]